MLRNRNRDDDEGYGNQRRRHARRLVAVIARCRSRRNQDYNPTSRNPPDDTTTTANPAYVSVVYETFSNHFWLGYFQTLTDNFGQREEAFAAIDLGSSLPNLVAGSPWTINLPTVAGFGYFNNSASPPNTVFGCFYHGGGSVDVTFA